MPKQTHTLTRKHTLGARFILLVVHCSEHLVGCVTQQDQKMLFSVCRLKHRLTPFSCLSLSLSLTEYTSLLLASAQRLCLLHLVYLCSHSGKEQLDASRTVV